MSNPVFVGDKIMILIDGDKEATIDEISVANPELRLPDAFYAKENATDGKTWCLNMKDEGVVWRRS